MGCGNTDCNGSCSSCCTDGASCPVGHVAIYDENQSFAGCVTPQEATIYNNDKVQCSAGYGKLIDPNSGEFIGCVLASDLSALLTQLEAATLHVGLTYINVTCNGDGDGSAVVVIAGGTAPYTTTWTDDALAGVNPAILVPGAYILTVTDAAGVSQVKYFNITEPDVLAGVFVAANETVPAAGDGKAEVFPTGGTEAYTYVWKDGGGFTIGQTTKTATNLVPDTYSCMVTDANGCTVNVIAIIIA